MIKNSVFYKNIIFMLLKILFYIIKNIEIQIIFVLNKMNF